MLKDFKTFVLRGNVMDLAVAVVIGVAFGRVIDTVVKGLVTPLLALPGKGPNLEAYTFTIAESVFRYGAVLDEFVVFVTIAAVVFFVVIRPVNLLMERRKTEPPVVTTTRDCPYCLSSIPIAATRCAFCTADVGAASG